MENNELNNVTENANEEKTMTNEELLAQIAALAAKIDELKKETPAMEQKKVTAVAPKNHVRAEGKAGKKYMLLTTKLESWGCVPKQQAAIADILAKNLEVGAEVEEKEVFNIVCEHAKEYASLSGSKQDPTYLLRYYTGLGSKDGKHGGFVARNFLVTK